MRTLGLTGGIGSGKSTVAAWLVAQGIPVIDADQVAREIVTPGSEALAAIVAQFGVEVLAADGTLDRARMGSLVVGDPAARAQLETITHPRIHERVQRRLDALRALGQETAAVEAALMVETGSFQMYDAVLLVDAEAETRAQRISARQGWEIERARAWVSSQLSGAERRRRLEQAFQEGGPPVVVVSNDSGQEELERRLDQAWLTLQRVLGLNR